MKRFLADIQSGLMGATISESYEMTHSSGKMAPQGGTYGGGTGIRSMLSSKLGMNGTQLRSKAQSQSEKEPQIMTATDEWYAARSQAKGGPHVRETESVKGLTEHVIHQRIDYDVEYEERATRLSESRTSDGKSVRY